jgi:hypothetical protein
MMVLVGGIACAHQPRITFGERHSISNPVLVDKPEISKAYYGILCGQPDYYTIKSNTPFTLYLNILVPDQNNSSPAMNVDVSVKDKIIVTLDGERMPWVKFHENFADDNYLKGPETYTNVGPGIYTIKVYNKNNQGNYSLAIGNRESFPLEEILKTAITLPHIKKDFFNKPAYSVFFTWMGGIIFVYILIVLILCATVIIIIRKIVGRIKKE